jgi:tRNA dimethylallyltransferase
MKPKIVVVCGPTASGKTKLGIELAKRLGGEVVSADSMQVYRKMDVGTAKPTLEEREGIPHYMMDVADPWENYSVARYVKEATACTDQILERGKLPIVVGGTGLYIDSLLRGLDFASFDPEGSIRTELREEAKAQGSGTLWTRLSEVDPEAAKRLHPNDEKRIIRALEVFYETGKTISEHNRESKKIPPRYESALIGLSYENRDVLKRRIDLRVDDMIKRGLEEEVRNLLEEGIPRTCTAMQAIGYKEFATCLEEGLPIPAAVEEIKLRSRQYAKRQLTWFRRKAETHWILWGKSPDFSSALQNSISFLQGEGLE